MFLVLRLEGILAMPNIALQPGITVLEVDYLALDLTPHKYIPDLVANVSVFQYTSCLHHWGSLQVCRHTQALPCLRVKY